MRVRTKGSGCRKVGSDSGGCGDWEGGDYGVGEFLGGGFAAEVAGDVLAFAIDFFQGGFDTAGCGALA